MVFHVCFYSYPGKAKDVEGNRRHTKGCNCKRSGCLKNYCECYEVRRYPIHSGQALSSLSGKFSALWTFTLAPHNDKSFQSGDFRPISPLLYQTCEFPVHNHNTSPLLPCNVASFP